VQCNKTLDSTLHCDGPDKDIYCRGIFRDLELKEHRSLGIFALQDVMLRSLVLGAMDTLAFRPWG